jgi:hypothetical protein
MLTGGALYPGGPWSKYHRRLDLWSVGSGFCCHKIFSEKGGVPRETDGRTGDCEPAQDKALVAALREGLAAGPKWELHWGQLVLRRTMDQVCRGVQGVDVCAASTEWLT